MKRLLWVIAVLPVVGVLGVLFLPVPTETASPDKKPQASPAVFSRKTTAASPAEFAPDGSRIISPGPEGIAAHKRYVEAKRKGDEAAKRRDAAFRKVAASSTSESRARIVDIRMRQRGKEYQSLFASWNLDPQRINDALAIIRERELQKSEHMNEYFKDASGKSKEYQSNKLTEDLISQVELEELLGKSRYKELSAAEKRMHDAEIARSGIRLPVRN